VRPPTTTRFAIWGPIARSDLPGLYRRVCAVLSSAPNEVLVCETSNVQADAVAVDALARLALGARRHGCQVRLRGASKELRELVEFMGLESVLPE
jgi:ABC-type transporter Mla MlaB component